jgi:hypothetical protein
VTGPDDDRRGRRAGSRLAGETNASARLRGKHRRPRCLRAPSPHRGPMLVPRSFARWPAGLRCSAAVYFQVRVVLCCPAVAPGGRGSTGLGVCLSSQCLVPAGQPEGMACRRVVAAVMSAAQGHRLARRSRRRRPLRARRREHRHALAPEHRFCVLRMDWIEAAVPVQIRRIFLAGPRAGGPARN